MSNGTITKLTNATVALGANIIDPVLDLLTAMGHGNGSGTTEEFTNFPGMPRVLNAANYGDPADSSETKINAMITAALAAGATSTNPYVGFIPISMLGYGVSLTTADSSHVLHNAAVHMVCEGGSFSLNEFDADAYGAKVNQDSYAAIQTCLNFAGNPFGKATVRLPTGTRSDRGYKLSKPLQLITHGTRLVGPREGVNTSSTGGGVWLTPTYKYGYTLAVMDDSTMPGLGTSLATGSGQSWSPGGLTGKFFNLRDAATLELHGRTSLTVAGFFQPTAADIAGTGFGLFSSNGCLTPTLINKRAFVVQTLAGGHLRVDATTSTTGTTTTLNGNAHTMVAGTTYYFEASWDGSNLRLFVGEPGQTVTLAGSTALTGTMIQQCYEDVTVGDWGQTSPAETNMLLAGVNGKLSSLLVDGTARHTATFTAPTAEHSPNANTLALMNWDEIVGYFAKVYVGTSDTCWAFLRDLISLNGTGPGWEISGINIRGSAQNTASGIIIGPNSPNGVLDRIYMTNVRTGIRGCYRDTYMHQFSNIMVDASTGWYAVAINGNNGQAIHWDTLVVFGGRILFATCQGLHTFTNCFFQTAAGTEIGVILSNLGAYGTVVTNSTIVTEVTPASTYLASLIVTGQFTGTKYGVMEWNGGSIAGARSVPPILVSQIGTAGFHGVTFTWNGAVASSIMSYDTAKPSLRPIRFDGCWQNGTWIPWSNTAGTAIVGKLGKLSAVTYSATPTFDCSARDEVEITLTGDCAPTITNVTPGQPVLVTIIQDGAGAHGFTWPANVKGGGTVSATGGSVNQQRFTAMLDSATNPTLMADAAMVSV